MRGKFCSFLNPSTEEDLSPVDETVYLLAKAIDQQVVRLARNVRGDALNGKLAMRALDDIHHDPAAPIRHRAANLAVGHDLRRPATLDGGGGHNPLERAVGGPSRRTIRRVMPMMIAGRSTTARNHECQQKS